MSPTKKRKVFIFDLDGTLADSRIDMARAVNRVRHLYDLPDLPEDLLKTLVVRGMDFLYRSAFPEIVKGDEPVPTGLRQKYETDYAARIVEETRVFEGIADALRRLSPEGTILVFTKKPAGLSRLQVEQLGLLPCIDEIVGGDSAAEAKPAAAPVEEVLRRLGILDAERFMIGDSQLDMTAARNLGATAVWCKWGYYRDAPADPSPQVVAREPADLIQILLD